MYKHRTCNGIAKHLEKWHLKNKEKASFPNAKPLILWYYTSDCLCYILLYILFDFIFTQLDYTRLQRRSKKGTLEPSKKGATSAAHASHMVHLFQMVIAFGLFLGCSDSDHKDSGVFRGCREGFLCLVMLAVYCASLWRISL